MDQNFGRSHRADARIAPCIIPKGKYVVTGAEKWPAVRRSFSGDFSFLWGIFFGKKWRYQTVWVDDVVGASPEVMQVYLAET